MDEEKKEAGKIDIFDPAIIFAFVSAFIGDFTFFLVITHYLCGIFVLAMFMPKTKGWLAKAVLLLAFLLPLPTLMIGIFLGIILSNKFLAFVAEQAAVIAATVFLTPAGGAAVEAGAVAELGAEAGIAAAEAGAAAVEAGAATAEIGAEAATAAAEVGEAGAAAAEGAEAATGAAEAGEAAEGATETGEAAEGAEKAKEGKSALEKAKDIKEKLDKLQGGGREEEGEEENEEKDLNMAVTGEERALLGEKGRLNEEFFEQPMQIPVPPETDEKATPQRNNVVSGEKFREAQKIQDIKRQQQKPKPLYQAPVQEENKDDENLKKAA